MISCKKGTVQIDGMQEEIEADIACIIRSYLNVCEKNGWKDDLTHLIELAKMSEDELDKAVVAKILKLLDIPASHLESMIREAMK